MELKQIYKFCGVVFVLLCFLLPQTGFDTFYWVTWVYGLENYGLSYCYEIKTLNYNPLYLYVLRAYTYMLSLDRLAANIQYLKIITLLFDFGAVFYLLKQLDAQKKPLFPAMFVLFNIAYLYNTLYWGQIDSIHTTLAFIAIFTAINKKFTASILLFLLAINVKTQALFFLPVLAMLWLPLLFSTPRTKIIKAVSIAIGIQLLILLPFIIAGTLPSVWNNFTGVIGYHKSVSMGAYNFWHLVLWYPDDYRLFQIEDTAQYAGVTYQYWGLLLFLLFFIIAVIPLAVKACVVTLKKQQWQFTDAPLILLTAAVVVLCIFFFLTQMHERYVHPVILLTGAYFVITRRWLIFALLCYAYLFNLETITKSWKLKNYLLAIYDARFIAGVYAIALLLAIVELYRYNNVKADYRELISLLSNKPVKA